MGTRGGTRVAPVDGTREARITTFQLPGHGNYNPYVDILRESLCRAGFKFDRAHRLRKVPRIVLLHWAENFWVDDTLVGWRGRRRSAIRRVLPIVLKVLRARGSKIVWFAHNSIPHEWSGSADAWFDRAHEFYDHVDAAVHLTNASSRLPVFGRFHTLPQTVVRHPHYDLADPIAHARQAGEICRVLMLGAASQPRKNGYSAVQAMQDVPNLRAVITGDLGSDFAAGFAAYPNVDLIDGILSEESLFALFDGATAVLLNQPNQLNSGVMFLGLSRGAAVICPDSASNREIQSMVGSKWIRLFEHPLSSEVLRELVDEPIPAELPDLTPFSPDLLGTAFRQWVDQQLLQSSTSGW